MSEVNAQDQTLIRSPDDVLPLYQGVGSGQEKIGIETELAFFHAETLDFMSIPENSALLNTAGFTAHNEPTSDVLEIASIADSFERLENVIDDTDEKIRLLTSAAQNLGLKRSWFEYLPQTSASALLNSIVDVERYRIFFMPVRSDLDDISRYFASSKATQVSVSYRDPDHLLENVRRLYFLTPFLFMFTENSAGFWEGSPDPIDFLPGMVYRGALKNRGGVPNHLFTAKTGEDYIHAHVNQIMNFPMFMFYDENGKLTRLPDEKFTSFEKLKKQGLNTAANYYLSQSTLWPDIKIAAIKDDRGNVFAHRFEARMFGVGLHQHRTAALIVGGLAFLPDFAQKTDALLKSFGFYVDQPQGSRQILTDSYKNARCHGNRFFDTPYGTGSMRDFALQFADLLEEACDDHPLQQRLGPALHICRTGHTDGFVNRVLFETLDSVKNHQKHFDSKLFDLKNACADTALNPITGRSLHGIRLQENISSCC